MVWTDLFDARIGKNFQFVKKNAVSVQSKVQQDELYS